MVTDTTKYVLLAANNSLQSVVHVHEKIIFSKVVSEYVKIKLMEYLWSPLIVILNTVKSMMVVLVCRFYYVCKYKASQGTAKLGLTAPRNYQEYTHGRFLGLIRLGPRLSYRILCGLLFSF